MNKQELLKTLEEWKKYRNSQNHELQYYQLAEVINLVEQLDEPQKVKVPAYVAEKMKRYKSALWMLSSEYFDTSLEVDSDELANWIDQNSEKFFRAWLDGYEVEEEPKYYIQLQGTTWGTYLVKSDDKDLLVWQNTRVGTPFTEQEIKSIDERYWPFAVPIEKVEE